VHGSKQAARLWYDHLVEALGKLRLKPSEHDACTLSGYIDSVNKNGENIKEYVVLVVHVGDLFITSSSIAGMNAFVNAFEKLFSGNLTLQSGNKMN